MWCGCEISEHPYESQRWWERHCREELALQFLHECRFQVPVPISFFIFRKNNYPHPNIPVLQSRNVHKNFFFVFFLKSEQFVSLTPQGAKPKPKPGQRQQQSAGVVLPLSSRLWLLQRSRPCSQPFFPLGGYNLQKELLDCLCSGVGKLIALQVLPVPN